MPAVQKTADALDETIARIVSGICDTVEERHPDFTPKNAIHMGLTQALEQEVSLYAFMVLVDKAIKTGRIKTGPNHHSLVVSG